jgi:hypothetical protein
MGVSFWGAIPVSLAQTLRSMTCSVAEVEGFDDLVN